MCVCTNSYSNIGRMELLADEGLIDIRDVNVSLDIVYRAFGYEDASEEDPRAPMSGNTRFDVKNGC